MVSLSRFVGIDLGGGRGKTTALCELAASPDGGAHVVRLRHKEGSIPLHDNALWEALAQCDSTQTVIAVAAPLTAPACERCTRPVCPSAQQCEEPSVRWMFSQGESMHVGTTNVRPLPYLHRATDLFVTFVERLHSPSSLAGTGISIRGRAMQLRRRLAGLGFVLNQNLIEVSPLATVAAMFGATAARGYKRDADPWRTRALILERLAVRFGPTSKFAREEVLQSDHRFDAMLCAYTAYLRQREGWQIPATYRAIADEDGWIWAPPPQSAGPR